MATTTQMIHLNGSGMLGGPANRVTSHTMKITMAAMNRNVSSQPRMTDPPTLTNGAMAKKREFMPMYRTTGCACLYKKKEPK